MINGSRFCACYFLVPPLPFSVFSVDQTQHTSDTDRHTTNDLSHLTILPRSRSNFVRLVNQIMAINNKKAAARAKKREKNNAGSPHSVLCAPSSTSYSHPSSRQYRATIFQQRQHTITFVWSCTNIILIWTDCGSCRKRRGMIIIWNG